MNSRNLTTALVLFGLLIAAFLFLNSGKTAPSKAAQSHVKPSGVPAMPDQVITPPQHPQHVALSQDDRQKEPVVKTAPETWVDRLSSERQQVYRDCRRVPGPEYDSSIFFGMDRQTKEAMAQLRGDEMQGCAAWHVATEYAAVEDTQQAQYYAVLASLALDSPEPLLSVYESFWTSPATKPMAVPYLLYAQSRWPNAPYLKNLTDSFDDQEKEEVQEKIQEVAEFASHVSAEHLGD